MYNYLCFITQVTILSLQGGGDGKKSIKFIMKKVFSREMAMKFSAMGKKGKRNFAALKLFNAVTGTTMPILINCHLLI